MLNHMIEKAVAFLLILLLPVSFLFSQTSPEELFPEPEAVKSEYTKAQGKADGERDAKGNPLYICGGAACGIFGVAFAALSSPKPPAHVMLELEETKGETYAMSYELAYTKKARTRNLVFAGVGWAAWIAFYLASGIGSSSNE